MEREKENKTGRFGVLSEGSVSEILSLTSPRDACRASSVSVDLKCLADSDAVWERFLPPDYQDIVSRSVTPLDYHSKKELYLRLCDSPILLDGARMSFTLKKSNGKKCFMLRARELSIAWKDTLVFWRWRSLPESRFSDVAELLAVCWLEIKGTIRTGMLSSKTVYVAYLVFNFATATCGLEFPLKASIRFVKEKTNAAEESSITVSLRPPKSTYGSTWQSFEVASMEQNCRFPQKRTDGWMEVELGEFFVHEGDDEEVELRFYETEKLHWKSGLVIEGIEIRPKDET